MRKVCCDRGWQQRRRGGLAGWANVGRSAANGQKGQRLAAPSNGQQVTEHCDDLSAATLRLCSEWNYRECPPEPPGLPEPGPSKRAIQGPGETAEDASAARIDQ